jgi:hypothetical protein
LKLIKNYGVIVPASDPRMVKRFEYGYESYSSLSGLNK